MEIDWSKHYRKQEQEGWCGVACVQMALSVCGIEQPQTIIAKHVYKEWWGSSQQLILAYLSRYFKIVNYKNSGKLENIKYHLNKNHIVIVNWWDETDGHYSIVGGYPGRMLTLIDPDGTQESVRKMNSSLFKKAWYDYVDSNNRIFIEGWMLWLDPESKKENLT